MTADEWYKQALRCILTPVLDGENRITLYIDDGTIIAETTAPDIHRPGYLIHIHADTVYPQLFPSVEIRLKRRIDARIKKGDLK